MPCGGITDDGPFGSGLFTDVDGVPCIQCGGPIPRGQALFVLEWDGTIHYRCLGPFLNSDEGKVVIEHGHEILVRERPASKGGTDGTE